MRLRLLILGVLLAACAPVEPYHTDMQTVVLRNDAGAQVALIPVEIADSTEEWKQGLMGRTDIGESGMLFVFPDEAERNFWMKDTLVPLDIIFFAADGSFLSSATMEPCASDPCPGYPSRGAAAYALEVAKGSLQKWNLQEGAQLELNPEM